jgi:hypothetical protein
MNNINLLLERCRSTDKNIRLKACKELSRASSLSNEATYALELAALDSEPAISHAARAVLQHHKLKKILTRLSIWIGAILGAGFILFMLYLIGLTSRLTCERVEVRAPVDCVEQVYFFSLIPLYQREFRDVRSAGIHVDTDSEDNESYTVELTTGKETDELEASPSAVYRLKRGMADEINKFISSDTSNSIAFYDHGNLTFGDAMICFGLPLAFLLVGGLIMGLKNLWMRIRPEHNRSGSIHTLPSLPMNSRVSIPGKPVDKVIGGRLDAYALRDKSNNSHDKGA